MIQAAVGSAGDWGLGAGTGRGWRCRRGGQRRGALRADLAGGAVVDRGRGVQADAAVPVFMVVGEERLAEVESSDVVSEAATR